MDIRPAKESQLLEVLYIIRECAEQLRVKGVKHWHNTHIDYEVISKDIINGYVYILFEKSVAVGTISIKPDEEISDAYNIDRLAIFPHFQRRGFARAMIDFAESETRNQGKKVLRGTIPVDDESLCKLLEEKGFTNHGVVTQVPNEITKILFEKKIE
ncbi:MAG TPA: GNAT family N-acetyltransferase [Tenuifilaceae bacterium]|nr:GNAT family N-acetyltransferase [Tenuifilaceae bacterium]HPE19216.1 GNAT family N-acetyltransferase [Tenuifilaceae bacterium]HPJ46309.1 GNAT family N-acetyltransferase [Tenuifilaceae bacterium]HPQ34715.1 GNAT family N-acetyltransferase [Tenuifilaceae bacterium]HRX68940.1 GNAT family N-acetyltransferase [Tenuifilaceae bacterium]